MNKWFLFIAKILVAAVAVEGAAFVLCLVIQRAEYRKYNKSDEPPAIPLLASRTGFLYQKQSDKFVYRPHPLLTYQWRKGIQFHNVEFPEVHAENHLWVSSVTGFVKNNSRADDPEPIYPDDRVVVFTGGSTVAGDDIDRNEHTIPSRLEAWLRDRCKRELGRESRIRVINAGVSGYNATQETSYFLYDLAFYQPLAWIQLSGINESWHLGMAQGSTELHFNKVTRGYPLPDPPSPSDWLPATQKLFLSWIPVLFRPSDPLGAAWPVERPEQSMSSATRFARTVAEASGAAAAVDVPHFFFLQPTLAAGLDQEEEKKLFPNRPDVDSYWRLANAFYSEARKEVQARKKRFPRWFDLSGAFPARESAEMYFGMRHYSVRGAEVLAGEIGSRIWPELRRQVCDADK